MREIQATQHLGEGVYVDYDGHTIELHDETNSIRMDPDVIEAFSAFTKRIAEQIRKQAKGGEHDTGR